MFQGRNFRIRRLSKDRYEFRSAYTLTYGTAAEMLGVIAQHTAEAMRSALELAVVKQKVRETAEHDGVAVIPEPVKPEALRPEVPIPEAAPAEEPVTRVRRKLAAKTHGIEVVEASKELAVGTTSRGRRPNSLKFLRALEQAERVEKGQ